ncbi:MAG TPA: hypothetical protein VMG59_10775 [Phycisphaerae bacterium]|nr:hypothetical protein [Phycisphaerae bacterium]
MKMKTKWQRRMLCVVAPAAVVLGAGALDGVKPANAAAFLWISAPTWCYSAATASSPLGKAYAWILVRGPVGFYDWAYAYSKDPPVGSGYAFAEAAIGRGGAGAALISGRADPYAGVGIDTTLVSSGNYNDYPQSNPASDPTSSQYTVSDTGITNLTVSDSNYGNGSSDEIEAFLYTGGTDETSLADDLQASGGSYSSGTYDSSPDSSDSGSTSTGDVTDISTLESDFGSSLEPLDAPMTDASDSLTSLSFTENDSDVNTNDVILVAEANAPEPAPLMLLAFGGIPLLLRRKRKV